jgi:PAS domain S-box-containing protein
VEALLASGVHFYMAVPMIAGGELIGALSFGGEQDVFPPEQLEIAQEVATQLAIAIVHARLFERVKRHAEELETANAQLRESERRFSDLLGNVQLISVMLDREARITYCNEYLLLLTGWRHEEVIGRSWVELFIPPESGDLKNRLAVLLADQPEGRHGDNQIVTRSGERRLIRWNNSVLRSAAGEVIGVASIGEDITERKRAEQEIRDLNASLERRIAERTQQLEASNKELESFTYSVSHDLRAPIRAIDGFARMLQEDQAERLDAEGRRLLDVVRANSKQMGQLIDDLLAFSKLGRQEPAKSSVDMAALVREVIAGLNGTALPRIETLGIPPAAADRALLKQVWLNLLDNAIKYSGKRQDARVEIGGRQEAGESLYWVRDNGVGFDMRYAGKLFGVFQRLHGADDFPGTGVGLAIVQRVVSRHGGRVWAEAKPGEGACFYFTLPEAA